MSGPPPSDVVSDPPPSEDVASGPPHSDPPLGFKDHVSAGIPYTPGVPPPMLVAIPMFQATDNIRKYLSEAVLPKMIHGPYAPPMPLGTNDKSGLNTLFTVRPDPKRLLETMKPLKGSWFDGEATAFIERWFKEGPLHLPDEDERTGERLTVPVAGFRVPSLRLARPSDMDRVVRWNDELPLATVQRALHLIHPALRVWRFVPSAYPEIDADIFRYYTFSRPFPEDHMHFGKPGMMRNRIVIAMQPPWVLSPVDIERFSRPQSMPPKDYLPYMDQLRTTQRVWGKIWDICFRSKIYYFALSSYDGWVFGAFSEGWTISWVTPVKRYDARNTTLVEALLYWVGSAIGMHGGWQIPELAEFPVEDGFPLIPPPPTAAAAIAKLATEADSSLAEDAWSEVSDYETYSWDPAATKAEKEKENTGSLPLGFLPEDNLPPQVRVHTWLDGAWEDGPPEAPDRPASPSSSVSSGPTLHHDDKHVCMGSYVAYRAMGRDRREAEL